MTAYVGIAGLDKTEVLRALYNAARPQGLGFLSYDPAAMTAEEAREALAYTTRFDYLKGRVIKVDLDGDEFDPYLYDRDNGQGSAAAVIDALRRTGDAAGPTIHDIHESGTAQAAQQAKEDMLDTTSGLDAEASTDEIAIFRLGVDEFNDLLKEKIDAATAEHE